MSQLRAVTFDLDGTLYDGQTFRRRYVGQNALRVRTILAARQVREGMRGLAFADEKAFFDEQTRRIATRLGRSTSTVAPAVARLFGPRVCRVLQRQGPRPTARACLQALLDAGLRVGVVSDYAVPDKIKALGLHDLDWSCLISTESHGALKPHPRAFLAAAEALGVAPGEVVHVGDRADTDGAGGFAAGMTTMLISPDGHPGRPTFDAVCRRILDRVA